MNADAVTWNWPFVGDSPHQVQWTLLAKSQECRALSVSSLLAWTSRIKSVDLPLISDDKSSMWRHCNATLMKLTDMPISRRIMVGFLCKKYKTKSCSSPTRVNDIGCFGESSLFLWYPSHCCAIGYTRFHRSVFVPDCYIRLSPPKEWCRTVMINFSIDCSLWHRDKTPNLLMFPAYKLLWIWFIMLCVTVSTQRSVQRMSAFKISYSNGFYHIGCTFIDVSRTFNFSGSKWW